MGWNDIEFSGHNHRHRCPSCGEIRWHHETKDSCLESNTCDPCNTQAAYDEFYRDIGNMQDIGGVR